MLGSGQQNLNVANGLNAIDGIVRQTAGNKDAIKRLIQSGIISEMQGVLAGMRADEISKAGMLGKGNMPTIAQQVLSPQPEPDMAPAPPPQMGMPGMSAPAPQMGVPSMPEEAPQDMPEGMAEGGLASLPVPDDMFNSAVGDSDTQHYAPGGLVAFADGGPLGPWFESQAVKAIPGIGVTSRQRSASKNAAVDGVPNSFHLTDNARDFAPPKGMSMGALADRLARLYGGGFDIINEGDHVHVEPGPKNARTVSPPQRNANLNTPQGRAISLDDSMLLGQRMLSGLPREGLDRAREAAIAELDPAKQEKDRKTDMWSALAEMGFRMAASNSPYVLQAIGEAATATLPGVAASKKERKEAKNEAIRTLMSVEDVDRKTATAGVELGMEVYKSGLSQEQFEQRMNLDAAQLAQQDALAREGFRTQKEIEAMRPESMDFRESFARRLFDEYRQRNATGQLYVNGKRLPPNSKSDAELYALAMQEVVNRMPQGQGAGMMDLNGDRVPDTLGGRSQAGTTGGNTLDFNSLK